MNTILTTINLLASIIIASFVISINISKLRKRVLKNLATDLANSVKLDNLNPNSDLYSAILFNEEINSRVIKLEDFISSTKLTIDDNNKKLFIISNDLCQLKFNQFVSSLRARLEYVIDKEGKVEDSYWLILTKDYTKYHNEMKGNSYVTKLFDKAANLVITNGTIK